MTRGIHDVETMMRASLRHGLIRMTSSIQAYGVHDPDEDIAIREWVAAGGGVIAGGHAWWWAYSTGSDDVFHDHPGNQWLGVAGITLSGSTAGTELVEVPTSTLPLLHAGVALDAAADHVDGRSLLDDEQAVRAFHRPATTRPPPKPGVPP